MIKAIFKFQNDISRIYYIYSIIWNLIYIEYIFVTLKKLGYLYMIVFYFLCMKKSGNYDSFPFNNKSYNKVARKRSDI